MREVMEEIGMLREEERTVRTEARARVVWVCQNAVDEEEDEEEDGEVEGDGGDGEEERWPHGTKTTTALPPSGAAVGSSVDATCM